MVTSTAMSSADMLGDLIEDNDELTNMLFNDSVKSVIEAAAQDSMQGDQGASTMVLD